MYLLSILWLFCVSICIYLKIQGMVQEYMLLSIYSSCLHFHRMFLGDGFLKPWYTYCRGQSLFLVGPLRHQQLTTRIHKNVSVRAWLVTDHHLFIHKIHKHLHPRRFFFSSTSGSLHNDLHHTKHTMRHLVDQAMQNLHLFDGLKLISKREWEKNESSAIFFLGCGLAVCVFFCAGGRDISMIYIYI